MSAQHSLIVPLLNHAAVLQSCSDSLYTLFLLSPTDRHLIRHLISTLQCLHSVGVVDSCGADNLQPGPDRTPTATAEA